jgi:hypothetical protein
MLREPLCNEIRSRLEAAFHDRLRRVLLFGSEVRGEAGEGSDVDLPELAREALPQRSREGSAPKKPKSVYGFEPLPPRGGTVFNELIDKLREED